MPPWDLLWEALTVVGTSQAEHAADEDPAKRFLSLVGAVLHSGKGHLRPTGAVAIHWDSDNSPGDCIGWKDETVAYLHPEAAFAAVQRLANDQQRPLASSAKAVWRRLSEAGLLVRTAKDGRNTYKLRVSGSILVSTIAVPLSSIEGEAVLAVPVVPVPVAGNIRAFPTRTG